MGRDVARSAFNLQPASGMLRGLAFESEGLYIPRDTRGAGGEWMEVSRPRAQKIRIKPGRMHET